MSFAKEDEMSEDIREKTKVAAQELLVQTKRWFETNTTSDEAARAFGAQCVGLMREVVRPCAPYLVASAKILDGVADAFGWFTERLTAVGVIVDAAAADLKRENDASGVPTLEEVEGWLTPSQPEPEDESPASGSRGTSGTTLPN